MVEQDRSIVLPTNFDYKFAIVIRTDLDMGKGKIAAQVGHAVGTMSHTNMLVQPVPETYDSWYHEGQRKVVLKVQTEAELLRLAESAAKSGLDVYYVRDAGRTQVEPGSLTCIGVGPAKQPEVDKVVGGLKLL